MSLRRAALDMKRCGACGLDKLRSEFNRNRANWDGLQSQCRSCQRATVARSTAKNAETHRLNVRRYAERWPEKIVVKGQVKTALKTGRLVRPAACDDCGTTCKPDAHHDDYTKPLEVRWLCEECHHSVEHGGRARIDA
jgi:hypothetical protein